MNNAPTTPSNPLLSQLADINGLDQISWWPLAPGWWLLLALSLCIAAVIAFIMQRKRAYRNNWKGETMYGLFNLKAGLTDQTAKDKLAELSVILRRISVQKFSREACAGLEGQAWIAWLEKHDPKKFLWGEYASLLTQMQYAPPGNSVTKMQVNALIDATKEWIR